MADDLKLFGSVGLDISTLKKDIEALKSEIKKGNKSVNELGKVFDDVNVKLNNTFKNVNISDMAKIFSSMEALQTKHNTKQLNSITVNNAKILQNQQKTDAKILSDKLKNEARISEINSRTTSNGLKQIGIDAQNRTKAINSETAAIKQQIAQYKLLEAQKKYTSTSSYNSFSNRFNSLADYLLASTGMYSAISAFNKVLDVNKDFEVQQISLQRVLDGTVVQMERLKGITFEVATETGNLVNDIQTIENLWIRTGVETSDAIKELSKVTAMGLNVAEFDNAEQSVSFLNAAINQMVNGDWKQAENILSSWAKVSDYTAVKTTKDLAEVVARSGSYAKQLGMSYHELNAMSAIVSERMAKSGEEIGTAFKSIFSRIQDENYYKIIESYGVKVTEVGKYGYETFRSFTDIMDDLNAKFKQLSEADYDVAIAEITKALGGTRQGNYIQNLIAGWDTFDEKVKISTESAGYVAEQNEKIMESFDKQLKQLQASLTELAVILGDAGIMDFLEGLVSGATWAVDAFNSMDAPLRNTIASVSELLIALGLLGAIKNKVFGDHIINKMYESLKRLYYGTLDMTMAQELLNKGLADGSLEQKDYNDIVDALNGKRKLETLNTNAQTVAENIQTAATTKLVTVKTLLHGVLKSLIFIIPMVIVAYNTWKNSQEELYRQQVENLKKHKEELQTAETLIQRYEHLTKAYKTNADGIAVLGEKTEYTNEEKAELKNITEQLIELFPESANLIDTETNAYGRQLEVLKTLNAEKKKDILDDSKLFLIQNKSSYDKALKERNQKQNAYDLRRAQLDRYIVDGNINPNWSANEAKNLSKLKKEIEGLNDVIEEYNNNIKIVGNIERELNPTDLSEAEQEKRLLRQKKGNAIIPTDDDEDMDYSGLEPLEDSKKKKYKPFEIDYRDFNNSIKALEYELNLLDRKEKFLEATGYKNQEDVDVQNLIKKYKELKSVREALPSKYSGNVDLTHRNIVFDDEGYYNTLLGETYEYKDFGINKAGAFNVTPILPDGTLIENLEDYIWNQLDNGKALEDLDIFMGGDYSSINEAVKAAIKLHDEQAEIYNEEANLLSLINDLADKNNMSVQEYIDNITNLDKITRIYNLYMEQIQAHNNKINELNKQHGEYKSLLVDVERRLNSLSPTSENYEADLEALTKAHDELSDKIRQTVLDIKDEQLAIEDINNSITQMIIDNLSSGLNTQKDIASKKLQLQQEKEIAKLQKQNYSGKSQDEYNSYMDNKINKLEKELKILNEQAEAQEKLNRLKKIQEEIDAVKADTRFAYIDETTGREIYTYDRGKVKELEKQYQDELQKQREDDNKQKIQDEIDSLKEQQKVANDAYNKALKDLEKSHKNQIEALNEYWERKLRSENIKQQALSLIQSIGYKNALGATNQFNLNMSSLYDEQAFQSYIDGKKITDSLFDGLFSDLDSYIAEYMSKINSLNGSSSKSSGSSSSGSSGSNSSNSSNQNNATATIPGVGTVPVHIDNNGKTTTSGLPAGTVVHTGGGDYEITGGTGGNYTAKKKYALGGVNDFTGLAQLDGTPATVETIFNATDGKKLYDLVHDTSNLSQLVANNISKNVGNFTVKSPTFSMGADISKKNLSSDKNKQVVIYINKVNADNFDEFMNSISPYISAR